MMKLIDLREFDYESDKIVSFDNNEFIFGNTEFGEGLYKRYLYKYNMQSKAIYKINIGGIDTCENAFYHTRIMEDYIYTNAYEVKENEVVTLVYRINLLDGKVEQLYATSKDAKVVILSDRYVVILQINPVVLLQNKLTMISA
jgi:hypothetical protein